MLKAKRLLKAVVPSSLIEYPSPANLQSTRLALHVNDEGSSCWVYIASGCSMYKLLLPKSQRFEVGNIWNLECDTRTCNAMKEKDLSATDLEHIERLKEAEPLESIYPLSNSQLRECRIIFFLDKDMEEEEGEDDPGVGREEAETRKVAALAAQAARASQMLACLSLSASLSLGALGAASGLVARTQQSEAEAGGSYQNAPIKPYRGEEIGFTRSLEILICENASSKMISAELPVSMRKHLPLYETLRGVNGPESGARERFAHCLGLGHLGGLASSDRCVSLLEEHRVFFCAECHRECSALDLIRDKMQIHAQGKASQMFHRFSCLLETRTSNNVVNLTDCSAALKGTVPFVWNLCNCALMLSTYLVYPVLFKVMDSALVDRCPHPLEIQSVVLAKTESIDCLILGSVDSSGHLIVSKLDTSGKDVDRLTFSVSPRDCGVGEGSWAGLCFSPNQWSMAAVARSFCKSVDEYDQDIHLRTLRTLWNPSSLGFLQSLCNGNESSIIAVTEGCQLTIWDLRMKENGGCVRRVCGSVGDIFYALCDSSTGNIAVGGADRTVTIYDPRRWSTLSRWVNCSKYEITGLSFSSVDSDYIYIQGLDYEVLCGQWKERKKAFSFRGDSNWLGFSKCPNRDVLGGWCDSGSIFVADVAKENQVTAHD
ncbi:hypothetical protein RJ639_042233 [Escallonia herrerae]|uniref:Uncharacterized protein n=1 Tax=Escallonia herrerae TaxID=1293975 RepID=A0AA88WMP7_9ASTE|nr:hypothetical protein RJ639_042233 [Escallonia herrerae]